MKAIFLIFALVCLSAQEKPVHKVFDVHLHGSKDISSQLTALQQSGVYKAAVSTSWNLQNNYRETSKVQLLFGLMFPCPNGKVPYSLQPCFEDGKDWPSLKMVEEHIKRGEIDFFGEILSQYYGISPSDSSLYPYYMLAQQYDLPVGIHTGAAGPDHGSPNFNLELGNPIYLRRMLQDFPNLKVWIMHSGDRHFMETIKIMQEFSHVYSDISVISDPDIVLPANFHSAMKAFIDAGLEDRLMFGTDNGDVEKIIASVDGLDFLSGAQKEKIFYRNVERFFGSSKD